ncbi:hypothetical protein FDB55_11275 [Clostridium botulinum]|uniref:Uncharacterized protein n=1 Tax=Clostridium botulinum TaxID=1491 RepID=A0A0M1LTT3_CLOBO|nr:hypothetical protein [Clostridium botulinum]KAI3344417.1 hypothetical protein CIT18_17530 [Clostridium botulinum]KOM89586.1 hypothetical protein ACP51_00935 [Clostridium botulinum]KOR60825.1 hypothetical protein ADT22_08055 [Clostridium botulinum]MBN1075025.1 hypothetical protein [Clostridium botulinum]MCS6110254.1 hypothetical protein [Clostridium botulinum]
MIKNNIKISSENSDCFDKKQIALAIRNATLNDCLECSLLVDGIINGCENCSLKFICDGIDKLSDAYTNHTTKVVNTFKLD